MQCLWMGWCKWEPRAQHFQKHSCFRVMGLLSWDFFILRMSSFSHFMLHVHHLPHPGSDPGSDFHTSDRPSAIPGFQLWKKWVWCVEQMGNLPCVGTANSTQDTPSSCCARSRHNSTVITLFPGGWLYLKTPSIMFQSATTNCSDAFFCFLNKRYLPSDSAIKIKVITFRNS